VDETFSAGTATAVKRWQRDLKLPETGVVERGRVSYTPGPIRVAQRLARLGAAVGGDVVSYTGTTRMVTVAATAGDTAWAVPGTKVTVRLPSDRSVGGTVTAVGAPAAAPAGASAAGEGQSDPERPGTDKATVPVTIAVADQRALGGLSGAPVDVRYVAQERRDVLTVPVDALLALAEGGYGVELTGPAGARIVPVVPGLFADGRVEVTAADLAEGTTVGVPG
jgi:peptidoglycan hydrolase-like protein with peptidoglycan-binding domain